MGTRHQETEKEPEVMGKMAVRTRPACSHGAVSKILYKKAMYRRVAEDRVKKTASPTYLANIKSIFKEVEKNLKLSLTLPDTSKKKERLERLELAMKQSQSISEYIKLWIDTEKKGQE